MARIQYSGLVTSINGSVGGTTFQTNLYGSSIKNKPHIRTPRTTYQTQLKLITAQVTRAWGQITSTQQQQWVDYANAYPVPTRLNPAAYLNGYNFFLKFNQLRVLAGMAIRATCSLTQDAIGLDAFEITESGGSFTFAFSYSSLGGDWKGLIFLSPKILSYTLPQTNKTRFIKSFDADSGSTSTDITAEYLARLGSQLEVGESYYLDFTLINVASGQIAETPTMVIEVTV